MDDKLKIFLWPDGTWVSENDIDDWDIDWYTISTGKSDDYAIYYVPIELGAEDIEELISLNALPGMLPDKIKPEDIKIEEMGKIVIPEGAIIIISHSKDINYGALTIIEGKLIVNAPNMIMEVITPKGKNA